MSTTSDGMRHGGQGVGSSSQDDQLEADIQRAMALSLETERLDELRRKRLGIPSLPKKSVSDRKPVAVTKSCSSALPRGVKTSSVQQQTTCTLSSSAPKGGDSSGGSSSTSSAAELDLMSFGFDHVMKNYSGPPAGGAASATTRPPGPGPLPSPVQSGMPLKNPHSFGMGQGLTRSSQSMRQPTNVSMISPNMETVSKNPFAPSYLPLNSQASSLSRFHQTRGSFAAPSSSADKFGPVLGISHPQKHMSRSSPSSPETRHRLTSKSASTTPAEGNTVNQETFSDLLSSLGVEIGGSKPTINIEKDSTTSNKSTADDVSLINLAPSFEQITSIHKSSSASGLSEQPPPLPPKARKNPQSHVGSHLEATTSSSIRRIHSNPSFGTMEASTSFSQNISSFGFASQPSSQTIPQQGELLSFPPATTPSESTDSSDLMLFRSSLADRADFFDFSYFDPLQPQTPEPAPEAATTSVPSEPQSQQAGTSTGALGSSESRSEDLEVRPRRTKPSEDGQRPASIEVEESEQAGKRPRSLYGAKGAAVEVAEPEPWIPKSAVTTASAKKSKPEKVFFGDGLFDLASQRDEEGETFAQTVSRLRKNYPSIDTLTNRGFVSSLIFSKRMQEDMEMSVKVVLLRPNDSGPITFTCDVNTSIQHVISQALCYVEGDIDISSDSFVLKVPGHSEYMYNETSLANYEYVQECYKFDQDVRLTLVRREKMDLSLARTSADDEGDVGMSTFSNLFDRPVTTSVSKMGINVLMDAFTTESEKLKKAVEAKVHQPYVGPLVQTVKAICATLASVESNSVTMAVKILQTGHSPLLALERLTDAVLQLVDIYCQAFDTDLGPELSPGVASKRGTIEAGLEDITTLGQCLRVKIASAHRLPLQWKNAHDMFAVTCQVFYGGQPVHTQVETWPSRISNGFFDKVTWHEDVELPIPISRLPREARICLTLCGVDMNSGERTVLGWVAVPLFNFRSVLLTGSQLLGLWPESRANPIGTCASNLLSPNSAILQVDFPTFKHVVIFPPIEPKKAVNRPTSFTALEEHEQYRLHGILKKDSLSPLREDDATFLWNKRHFCTRISWALARILQVAPSWDWACLADVYALMEEWIPLDPLDALQLLHPRFADQHVRSKAVQWIQPLEDDELCDYLPQLVQALKYESYHDSALASFLIERALSSIRIAQYLYWYLHDSKHDHKFSQRAEMVLCALLSVCGRALRQQFRKQDALMLNLSNIAEQVKAAKDSVRPALLHKALGTLPADLSQKVRLPTNPSLEINGIDVQACSYFTSFTVPLKLHCRNIDPMGEDIVIMFKAGEDMRQDMLTMQMIRIMDKLWLADGLDLRMVTFRCMTTGAHRGLVELVPESETLRKIQVEHGVTGSFKDKVLAEWLQKHNPTELNYQKAVENFTYSCAGYCVATYVLGIGDRHNDNIMVTKTGHMFHVDFGKFLGNAQMFGNVKRDRTPFVLTSDMAYVINGGEKSSSRFQEFIDLCCEGFNLVRRHANLFFNLFGLMLNTGISQLSKAEDLKYVQNALKPQASDVEATAMFTRMIEASLGAKSTQINFFFHNLAQMSFSASSSTELSFAPKRYTLATDGKIQEASVFGIQKRYETEKYYVYIVRLLRVGSTVPTFIFRRYSEFEELHDKLGLLYPQHGLPPLLSHRRVGRTHVKQVAERRKKELERYLRWLFTMPPEVSQCDLVYTFFHPSLRDEKDAGQATSDKVKASTNEEEEESVIHTKGGQVGGQVKLAIQYRQGALFIMVIHAKDLGSTDGGDPDPYVKTYLTPDPQKTTKRKTRVVRKTRNPTYNEMLVYKYSKQEIERRTLHLTVWNSDLLKENAFLGATNIPLNKMDLSKETTKWHHLGDLT
ncbi:phosphatidylinositol 4-phosphate 3-kinase C2 domain-containing subunit beta-like [Lytechinus variegatus]|uniref:phosphatidylinositol 4-phosphate 3-kinase C2 domain-containing subunit beta-like n=1 Tax=Lytechinus variegatus TaxID=7654 RepID=UPI001BB2AE39|nr:phosphatidylinositol 4-phosphate 3-kinase C2 domain-containing subunit beta-like [Lytechinus variegatus]